MKIYVDEEITEKSKYNKKKKHRKPTGRTQFIQKWAKIDDE